MQYLIQPKDSEPFFTKWYDFENNYSEGMIVYELITFSFTTDGENWQLLNTDRL